VVEREGFILKDSQRLIEPGMTQRRHGECGQVAPLFAVFSEPGLDARSPVGPQSGRDFTLFGGKRPRPGFYPSGENLFGCTPPNTPKTWVGWGQMCGNANRVKSMMKARSFAATRTGVAHCPQQHMTGLGHCPHSSDAERRCCGGLVTAAPATMPLTWSRSPRPPAVGPRGRQCEA
jgi:hypothetical protein